MKLQGGPHDGEIVPLVNDPEAVVRFTFFCCAAEYRTIVGEDGLWFVRADRAVCKQPITTDDVLSARRYFTDRPKATLSDLQ